MRHNTFHHSSATFTIKYFYLNGLFKVTKEFLIRKHSNWPFLFCFSVKQQKESNTILYWGTIKKVKRTLMKFIKLASSVS